MSQVENESPLEQDKQDPVESESADNEATMEPIVLLVRKQLQILADHGEDEIRISLSGSELWRLHSVVSVAATHPLFERLPMPIRARAEDFREQCRKIWVEMGLTEDEARFLDQWLEWPGEE